MEYGKLKLLASKIHAYCYMNIEAVTNKHIILKSNKLGYRLIMDFEEKIPYLNIDTLDQQMTNEIMAEVATIIKVYNVITVGEIKF